MVVQLANVLFRTMALERPDTARHPPFPVAPVLVLLATITFCKLKLEFMDTSRAPPLPPDVLWQSLMLKLLRKILEICSKDNVLLRPPQVMRTAVAEGLKPEMLSSSNLAKVVGDLCSYVPGYI